MTVAAALAFSSKDVWAFGTPSKNVGPSIRYAARYDGHAWHHVRLSAPVFAVNALSERDMWAIGPTPTTAARPLAKQTVIAMHWTGRSWHTSAVPKIRFHSSQSHIDQAFVAVAAPDNVWWSYAESHGTRTWIGLLRWDGRSWRQIKLPASIDGILAMAQDGDGGLWLLADTNLNSLILPQQSWYHYSHGRWTSRTVRAPHGYTMITLFAMTWIPRTTGLWTVGGDFRHRSFAVIVQYGPHGRR